MGTTIIKSLRRGFISLFFYNTVIQFYDIVWWYKAYNFENGRGVLMTPCNRVFFPKKGRNQYTVYLVKSNPLLYCLSDKEHIHDLMRLCVSPKGEEECTVVWCLVKSKPFIVNWQDNHLDETITLNKIIMPSDMEVVHGLDLITSLSPRITLLVKTHSPEFTLSI